MSENSFHPTRSDSAQKGVNLPKISNSEQKTPIVSTSPLAHNNSVVHQYNRNSLTKTIQLKSNQKIFNPPNITFFKQTEIGHKGSLFHAQNERQQAQYEAQLVENRVRVLQQEEQKMMRKIDEARKQAQKLIDTREAQNFRYLKMMEYKVQKEAEKEALKQKNLQMKENMGTKYQEMKNDLFRINREDYLTIRNQRHVCLETKYKIMADHVQMQQKKYREQKSAEIRLKEQLQKMKISKLIQNKSRYDQQLSLNYRSQNAQTQRMKEASEKEEMMMAKLQNTMIEQRQVLSMLQDAMYQNSLKKSDRVNSMLDVEPEKTKTLNDINNKRIANNSTMM